jgi:hypothetical protein
MNDAYTVRVPAIHGMLAALHYVPGLQAPPLLDAEAPGPARWMWVLVYDTPAHGVEALDVAAAHVARMAETP